MSVTKTLHGTTYTIPETREKKWGASLTSLLSALTTTAEGSTTTIGSVPVLRLPSATSTLYDSDSLTPTMPWHRISGAVGAISLNTIVAIDDGVADGQILVLSCTSATNTVVVPDGANTLLNGEAFLGLNEALVLIWSTASGGDWIELFRSF